MLFIFMIQCVYILKIAVQLRENEKDRCGITERLAVETGNTTKITKDR